MWYQIWTWCGFFRQVAVFLLAALLVACTDSRTSLGNSAESGNPELAGVVRFSDGTPAPFASVAVVPAKFSAAEGIPLDTALVEVADSLGRYAFSRVPPGMFTLEAFDSASGKRFLQKGISVPPDSTFERDCMLESVGSVRLGAHGFADGTSGIVHVPGTTILRHVTVELGNIFVDSLPSDSLWPLVFVSEDGYSLSLENGVTVVSDSTRNIDEARVSFGFRFPLDMTASGIDLTENLRNFPLVLRLDSGDFDFGGLERIRGTWTAILCSDTLAMDNSYADFERESFVFWVRIPKLRAGAMDTLYLYFDEGAETSFADSAVRVFSDGFVAAYHFDENEVSAHDATGNGFDGIPESLSVAEDAAVGGALSYDGKKGFMTIPNSEGGDFDVTLREPVAFSVWVKMADTSLSHVVFGKGATGYNLKYLHGVGWLYEVYTDEVKDSTADSLQYLYYWYADSSVAVNEWTQLVVTQDSSGAAFYVNGELATSTPQRGTHDSTRITDSLFVVGKLVYPADDPTDLVTHYFHGVIDELHLSRDSRSAAWIRTSFENQNPARRWPVPQRIAE